MNKEFQVALRPRPELDGHHARPGTTRAFNPSYEKEQHQVPDAQKGQSGPGSPDQVSDQRVFQVTLHCVSEAIVALKLRAESAEAAAQLAEEIAEKNIPSMSFPLGEADRYENAMTGLVVCAVRPSAPGASYNLDDLHQAELMRSKIFPEEPIRFGRPTAPPSEDCLNN